MFFYSYNSYGVTQLLAYFCSVVNSRRLAFWRRPLLVMAPLGIVTATELAFAAMFIALLIWSLYNYLYVSFIHLDMQKADEKVYVSFTLLNVHSLYTSPFHILNADINGKIMDIVCM